MENKKIGDIKVIDLIAAIMLRKTPIEEMQKKANNFKENYEIIVKKISTFVENLPKFIEHFKNAHHISILKSGWILTQYVEDNSNVMNLTLPETENFELINGLFINFFCNKKFINLEKMARRWNKNIFFESRRQIIDNSIILIKKYAKDKKVNIYNFILPVLFAQIDGLCYECLEKLGYKLEGNRVINKSGKAVKKWAWIKEFDSKEIYNPFVNLLISEILFGHKKNEFLSEFNTNGIYNTYNRNKIIHGEEQNYGTLENTIRTYLILDFLFEISNELIKNPSGTCAEGFK